jgi:O-antigen/teichoic acid export membrane protein
MIDIEGGQAGEASGAEASNDLNAQGQLARAIGHRRQRQQRMTWAWGTSLASTVTTIAIQVLAIPLVYHSLGQGGYAAYAAITASAGLIGILNLGIGGSLVTPIAAAAAEGDKKRQAVLVQAGLAPLIVLCLMGAGIVIPAVALLPLGALFGKVGAGGSLDLRFAAMIAVSVALAAVPLSATDVLRQAFQEMHISNLFGAASNVLVCLALLFAASHSRALAVFVAAFTLPPLVVLASNSGLLIGGRRYLLRMCVYFPWRESRRLLGDGIRFLSASFSFALVYQWPVYWIARMLPASESAPFAISMQVALFPISFALGFLRPMWSSTADAHSRGDHAWLEGQLRKARVTILLTGAGGLAMMLLFGQQMVRIWIRQPITMDWQTRGLVGIYIVLAMWEQLHFLLALGLGHLRKATAAVFQRSILFAVAVPVLTALGGPRALWFGMCCSILFWTAWRLPGLMHAQVARVSQG